MEPKIYIVEKEVALGVWELLNPEYFTDKHKATNAASHCMEVMKTRARVRELKLNKIDYKTITNN